MKQMFSKEELQAISKEVADTEIDENLIANPTLEGDEETLSSIGIKGTNYAVGGGDEVHLYYHYITLYDNYVMILYTNSATPLTTSSLTTNYKGTFNGGHKVGTSPTYIVIHAEIVITNSINITIDKLDITNSTITSTTLSNMTVLSDTITQIF